MSVNRPQTTSITFAILTLFAAAAWGQQKGTDIPVYESDNAIFGADSLSDTDLFQKTSHETEIEASTENDSPFGSSAKPMVDKNGYFLPTAGGAMWKDIAADSERPARWARLEPRMRKKKKPDASPLETVMGPVIDFQENAETQTIQNEFDSAMASKLRLRIGFDALFLHRSSGENTIFATDDNGRDWAFSDFDFSEGDARYFIQFMGTTQRTTAFRVRRSAH